MGLPCEDWAVFKNRNIMYSKHSLKVNTLPSKVFTSPRPFRTADFITSDPLLNVTRL